MNQFRAVTISAEGNAQEVLWDASNGTLGLLQQSVEGLVDVVALSPQLDMWINDEGIVRGMAVNPIATQIARLCGRTTQPYYGPVVLTGGADQDGVTLPLSTDQAVAILALVHQLQHRQDTTPVG